MKNSVRSILSCLLVATLLLIATPPAPQAAAAGCAPNKKDPSEDVTDVKVKHGAEVAARVRQLKERSKDVRAALKAFEKNGRAPKIDEAVSISGKVRTPRTAARRGGADGGPLFRPAAFRPRQEQTTLYGDGVEMIFVTALHLPHEWQGTIIANRYDEYGNFVEQYVADMVMTAPESDPQAWTARYEVSFEGGTPYLMHQPGMYAGFSFGTSVQEHQTYFGTPAPLDLESWQFPTPQDEQLYYEYFPEQEQFQKDSDGRITPYRRMEVSRHGGAFFRPAVFSPGASAKGVTFARAALQTRSDRAIERHQIRCPGGCGPSITQAFPRLGTWARETGMACGGAAAGCGLATAIFAAAWGPCFVTGCTGAAVYHGLRNIFNR